MSGHAGDQGRRTEEEPAVEGVRGPGVTRSPGLADRRGDGRLAETVGLGRRLERQRGVRGGPGLQVLQGAEGPGLGGPVGAAGVVHAFAESLGLQRHHQSVGRLSLRLSLFRCLSPTTHHSIHYYLIYNNITKQDIFCTIT